MDKRDAGRLNEKVAFDERADQEDGHGNVQDAFVEQFQRRAGFTYMRGGETVIASRLEGRQPTIVRVRRDSDTLKIGPDWRMRDSRNGSWQGTDENRYWDGPIYAVRSIAPTEDRQFLDIMVESGVAP
ncbi:head-tail adaptor protein [Rhizobium cauense]|uniref:phage head completion protein n=1 Tax=Rhizobium cauense TaxID=1166683 RepID=UPI001C6DE974|nr:head-tail adaptor protein [Rhizobium cauense]MBW9113149.1 head-tail adaptor protein [Rhizobium cauense]